MWCLKGRRSSYTNTGSNSGICPGLTRSLGQSKEPNLSPPGPQLIPQTLDYTSLRQCIVQGWKQD